MPGGTSGSTRVASSQIFDRDSLNHLKGGGSRITGISRDGEQSVVRVAKAPVSESFLARTFNRFVSIVRGELRIGRKLYHIYLKQFQNLTAKTVTSIPEGPVSPHTFRLLGSHQNDLKTPIGFRVAAAMELAGVCKLSHGRRGEIKFKESSAHIDDVALRRVDYFVNLNPHRLAFEFLAQNKTVPNGYLERVLIPHYCERLINEASMGAAEARDAVKVFLDLKGLKRDKDVDLEPLMEMRNALDCMAADHQRNVQAVVPCKRIPKGPRIQGGIKNTVSVTADHVLEHGTASRQVAREYFIAELRSTGVPRSLARERVAAVLNQKGVNNLGSHLPLSCFLDVARTLGLDKHRELGDVVKVYLGLVDQLHAALVDMPSDRRMKMLRHAGVSPEETYVTGMDSKGGVKVIDCPELEKPKDISNYSCNEDELWLIQARVDRSFRIRVTKDILKRVQRYAARNKRNIFVDAVTRVLTSAALGAVSGGIMGAVYMVTSTISSLCMVGVDFGSGLFQFWKGGRSVIKYDEARAAGQAESEDMHKELYKGLCTLTGEKALTDIFNAYANLQDDLEGLEKLKGKANLSAAEQIRFRRHQVMQQLRTAQLGEAFKDMDHLVVQTVSDISRYESEFEEHFDKLWEPFNRCESEGGISSEHRLKIFRKAILNMKDLPVSAKSDHHSWLKQLAPEGERIKDGAIPSGYRKHSDKILHEAFGGLDPLPLKELRVSAFMAKLNWARSNMLEAAQSTALVITHFIWTTLTWNASKIAKATFRWFVQNVIPRKIDVAPIPSLTVVVYWIASFVGGRISEIQNNYLNRQRVSKIVESRKNEEGEDLALDAEVTKLSAEDWRAMRRESQLGMERFCQTLAKLREEHLKIAEEVKKQQLSQNEKTQKITMSDDELEARATLILRRKFLEQEIQELLSGAIGRFFEETVRGEMIQNQLMKDVETGFVSA